MATARLHHSTPCDMMSKAITNWMPKPHRQNVCSPIQMDFVGLGIRTPLHWARVTGVPRQFDLVTLLPPIPLRVFRTVPTIKSPAFERIDIAECAGVGEVELDDIVAVVEWCARVCPRRRNPWNHTSARGA